MVVDLPLELLVPWVLQRYELNQRMERRALLLVDDLLLEPDDRWLHNELRLSGKTSHHLIQRIVLDEVL